MIQFSRGRIIYEWERVRSCGSSDDQNGVESFACLFACAIAMSHALHWRCNSVLSSVRAPHWMSKTNPSQARARRLG